MKIGIIGANGFIGRSLINYYSKIEEPAIAFARRQISEECESDAAAFHNLNDPDISSQLTAMDGIVICTGSMLPSDTVTAEQLKSAALETQLIEKCIRKVKDTVIYISSGGAVYGNAKDIPATEKTVCEPISAYGKYKLAQEKSVAELCGKHAKRLIIARVSNPYGEFQDPSKGQGLIARLLQCCINKETFTLWGDGQVIRDYIHIEDFCGFINLAAKSRCEGIYNVGSGNGYSITDILDLFTRLSPHSPPRVKQVDGRKCDVLRIILDIEKAKHDLKWQPKHSLNTGISELLTRQCTPQ